MFNIFKKVRMLQSELADLKMENAQLEYDKLVFENANGHLKRQLKVAEGRLEAKEKLLKRAVTMDPTAEVQMPVRMTATQKAVLTMYRDRGSLHLFFENLYYPKSNKALPPVGMFGNHWKTRDGEDALIRAWANPTLIEVTK